MNASDPGIKKKTLNAVKEIRLMDYVHMLRRRFYTVLVVFFSVLLSTIFFMFQKPDEYRAFCTLVIEESQSAFSLAGLAESGRPMGFYQGILSSRSYLEEVLDSIGTELFEKVLPQDERDSLAMLSYIRDHVNLGSSNFATLLQFTATAGTKELAYQLARTGTIVFRKKCGQVDTEQSKETIIQIENQIVLIRKKLEEAEKEFQTYRDRTGLSENGIDSELQQLQDIYYKERTNRTLKEAEYEATRNQVGLAEAKLTPLASNESQQVRTLRAKLMDLEKEKRRLLSLDIAISPASPLQKEINGIEQELLKEKGEQGSQSLDNPKLISQWQSLRSQAATQELDLEFSKKRLLSFRKFIEEYKAEHPEIMDQVFHLSRLNRTRKLYEETYNILLGKVEEAKIKNASEIAGIKVIDPAYLPNKPIPKNAGKFYLAGALVGLLLGIGVAFFLEFNDTTLKSSDDVERHLGLAVIGTIPHIVIPKGEVIDVRRTTRSPSGRAELYTQYPKSLIDFNRDESIASEAYRSLRTNLLYASPDKPLKILLMTSSGPGEGKSLTVANMALAYAQMGSRTLLVDTDLRRPVIHHLFQMRREPGFCELFLHDANWDEIIRPTKMENLFVIPAGRFTPSPAELVGARKMDHILEEMRKRFDMVLFDTPPLVAVTDATVLSKKLDGVVLLIKSGKTERELAKRALNILHSVESKIIGAVLNDIDLSHRYSSYGYYKYYYHYYQSKKD